MPCSRPCMSARASTTVSISPAVDGDPQLLDGQQRGLFLIGGGLHAKWSSSEPFTRQRHSSQQAAQQGRCRVAVLLHHARGRRPRRRPGSLRPRRVLRVRVLDVAAHAPGSPPATRSSVQLHVGHRRGRATGTRWPPAIARWRRESATRRVAGAAVPARRPGRPPGAAGRRRTGCGVAASAAAPGSSTRRKSSASCSASPIARASVAGVRPAAAGDPARVATRRTCRRPGPAATPDSRPRAGPRSPPAG